DTEKRHGVPPYAIRRRTRGFGPTARDASLGADASEQGKITVSAGAKLRSALRKHPFLLGIPRLVNLVAIHVPSLSTWSASMKTKRAHSVAECRETSDPCAANLQR